MLCLLFYLLLPVCKRCKENQNNSLVFILSELCIFVFEPSEPMLVQISGNRWEFGMHLKISRFLSLSLSSFSPIICWLIYCCSMQLNTTTHIGRAPQLNFPLADTSTYQFLFAFSTKKVVSKSNAVPNAIVIGIKLANNRAPPFKIPPHHHQLNGPHWGKLAFSLAQHFKCHIQIICKRPSGVTFSECEKRVFFFLSNNKHV